MIHIENISNRSHELFSSRRGFLKGMLGAGAFVLSVRLMPEELFGAAANATASEGMAKAALRPSVYLAIDMDGTAYIIAHRSEMGSGSRTALPRIVADELDADWSRVKLVQATGDEKYGDQDTDGSHSVRSFFDTLRESGATARLMLIRAAAAQWSVPPAECSTNLHTVVHKASGKQLGYGELAAAAAKLDVPKKEEVKLKPRSEWRYVGKGTVSYDLKDMCTGKAGYGQDTRMDGMLYASVARPPVFGSSVKSVDDKAALSVAGVKKTETIEAFKPPIGFQALGGVAVLADNTWAAMQGRKKLKIEWEKSPHGVWNSDAYKKELQETARKPGKVVRENGNVDEAFAKGGKIVEAEYYAPLLAHASMEPPAALALFRDGKAEVWAPTQGPQGARDAIAQALGLKKEDVIVHVTLLGGGFGRKSFPDFAVEAAVLSKKTGTPVKVVWSREDDVKFDVYHSVAAMYMKAALGSDGRPRHGCSGRCSHRLDRHSTPRIIIPTQVNLGWVSRTSRSPWRAFARRTDRRRRIRASVGSAPSPTSIMRSEFIRLRMSWPMRPEEIPWNTCCSCLGRTASCRGLNSRRNSRTTAETTSNTRSIPQDFGRC